MQTLEIGPCKLYHGDALEILPKVRAHLIVTDPPYKLTSGGPDGEMGGCFSRTEYDNKGGIVDCDIDWPDFMPLCFNALYGPAHAYFMANNRHVQGMLNAAESAGFHFHNLLVWDKISATPNRWYMKNCEFVGFFKKGQAFFINDCSAKQLISCPQVDVSDHPTEKPVALMQYYIEQSSVRGQIVLDPFMGSGSTGVAAVQSGMQFIGIEKDEDHFKTAAKRIKFAYENHMERLI